MLIPPHIQFRSQDWSIIAMSGLNADLVKVVVVGAPQVGKTSFIRAFWELNQPEEMYHLDGVEVYPCRFTNGGIRKRAAIFEISGDPAFGKERIHQCRDAHVIVWMYAIDNPLSFEILRDTWLPEAEDAIPLENIHSMLVGNKRDLRDDPETIRRLAEEDRSPVTSEQAYDFLHHETIMHISEISSNRLEDVEEVVDAILFLQFN